MLKLDFGCGPNVKEGFEGVDQYSFDGKVKHVMDVNCDPWPWEESSVDEAHASHFIEHLDVEDRVMFFNNVWTILKPGAQFTIICPHWSSTRAYGDPTHKWPAFSEMALFYLDKDWRAKNAPHTDAQHWRYGYLCDFTSTWGYSIHESLLTRNLEFQQFAISYYKEAAQDIHATLTVRKE